MSPTRITASSTLVVVVIDRQPATKYTPYLDILQEALRNAEIPVTVACVSKKWTRFILGTVPTNATFDEIRREVEMLYPEIRVGQFPRWLTTAEQRASKDASAVVLTVVGQETTKSIGRSQARVPALPIRDYSCSLIHRISIFPRTTSVIRFA
jgi:hypothetical protein